MKQYISFGLQAGLANRIKRLFTSLRFEVDFTQTLDLYWSISDSIVTEGFSTLFDFDIGLNINEIICNEKVILKNSKDVGKGNIFRLLVEDGELPSGFTQAYIKDISTKEYIDFEYERIPYEVRKPYLKYFQSLKPSEKVLTRINQIDIPEKCVGVHVRLNNQWRQFNRGTDDVIEEYFAQMDSYPKDYKFYLASCDELISKKFKEVYGNRIIELIDKDFIGSIDAVADLYLLAKTKELIGAYISTFTEMAWWLSGCSQKVIIMGKKGYENNIEEAQKNGKINTLLKSILKRGIKWFMQLIIQIKNLKKHKS